MGETYRAKQLNLQLPKQDLGIAWCKYLEKSNHTHYDQFINFRNQNSLDVGYVRGANEKNCVS